jgi:uncharacterized protein
MKDADPGRAADQRSAVGPGAESGWGLREQIVVVLALSLLESAAFALVSLLEAPVDRSVAVATFRSFDLVRQLLSTLFGLAPVALVLYLVRRPGEGGLRSIGIDGERLARDLAWAIGLAALVGAAGLGVYAAAIELGINRLVIPVPPLGHWWTIPVLILGSTENALLEEVVVVGYLVTRLPRLGWGPASTVLASGVLRGSYHLYQGWGGFAGNLALGLFFGWLFVRTKRLWPLVVAHVLLDVGAGLGYIAFCPVDPFC